MMAIGAIRAVTDSGHKVPDDIAVVGGDDILLAQYFAPPITTIRQSMFHIGHLAASEMIAKLNNEEKTKKIKIEVPMELIVRDSCGSKMVLNK
jgi:LacI family transcriptional regulator